MRLTTLLTIFSIATLICLTSCGVKRENVDLCIINAPNENRKCYNMARDYDESGNLKAGAKPVYRSNKTVKDLNKGLFVDSDEGPVTGLARLKGYLKNLREAAQCK